MVDTQLGSSWKEAGRHLGFRVTAPYTLSVNNISIPVAALLPDFGGPRGMLLVSEFSQLEPYLQDIEALGYGFSVLSADSSDACDAVTIEVLADWGWSGRGPPPSWLSGP